MKNYNDGFIESQRDLEDFARLWICGVPVLTNGYQVTLSWASVSNGSPAINLFDAVETNGGTGYANPADGLFTPDPNNPVVFRLRKKGVGTDLITSQYGAFSDFQIHIPRDGTPVTIDLLQRKISNSGQMQITEIKPEFKSWKQATNWMFRMEIPDGGFVEENDEFPFEAPTEGYQSVLEFNFQKDQPDWTEDLKKDYYIKFGNPPRYGRLHIQTGISYGGAILTYAINPTGSRNLEPK